MLYGDTYCKLVMYLVVFGGTKTRATHARFFVYLLLQTCTVLKIMDAGYCLYVHIFMKNGYR